MCLRHVHYICRNATVNAEGQDFSFRSRWFIGWDRTQSCQRWWVELKKKKKNGGSTGLWAGVHGINRLGFLIHQEASYSSILMLPLLDLMWRRSLHACQLLCISPHLPCHTCHLEYAVGAHVIRRRSGHTHLSLAELNFLPRRGNDLRNLGSSPLTSYLLLFSYSIKHIQIYTICRKTDDCTLHIKKRKPKKKKSVL